ncbi:MAG TPA: hypothetical protein DCZ38_05195 [Coxiellaceae bacterium]|nr:hypothetical protein [Coxiellaceae bacterium]
MKKNIKLKSILVAVSFMLLQTQVSADPIVDAITKLNTDVIDALNGGNNTSMSNQIDGLKTQMTTLSDNTFKGVFDSNGNLTKPATINIQFDYYIKNLYGEPYTTKFFRFFPKIDFSKKNMEIDGAVQKLLSQDIGYNTQKDLEKKSNDSNKLLAQPIETNSNNIDEASLAINPKDKTITPYGSLDDQAPLASNAPSVTDLIGSDSYTDDATKNKAKLFISYLLQASPAPKSIYIPDRTEAVNNQVSIYLPYASGDQPYTTISGISTKAGTGAPQADGSSPTESEYDSMLKYLKSNANYYQKYKMKTRAANTLRSIYLETILRLYQERTKTTETGSQSLVEKEKAAAFEGLDKKYYDDLKDKSVADVNLETLRAINKLAYFVYKLHEDNERSTLLLAVSGLQMTGQSIQDETLYIKPLGTLIKNKCWNPADDTIRSVCDNPMASSASSMQPSP